MQQTDHHDTSSPPTKSGLSFIGSLVQTNLFIRIIYCTYNWIVYKSPQTIFSLTKSVIAHVLSSLTFKILSDKIDENNNG